MSGQPCGTDEEATDEEAADEKPTDEKATDEDCHILPLTGLNAFVYRLKCSKTISGWLDGWLLGGNSSEDPILRAPVMLKIEH